MSIMVMKSLLLVENVTRRNAELSWLCGKNTCDASWFIR
jgi:hypothetical protein